MKIPFPLLAQFAYDIPTTRSIGMKSFEDIHGQNPKKPLDFLPISPHEREHESPGASACHFHALHHVVNKRI